MKSMRAAAAVVTMTMAAGACGPGLASEHVNDPKAFADTTSRTMQRLVDAIEHQDVAAITALLGAPFHYGGLWFSDPECTRQFPAPHEIADAQRPAFAKCLAALPLHETARHDAITSVAVMEYAPGIEVEIEVEPGDGQTQHPTITWIGYSARHDLHDALPTISGTAMDALRTAGTRAPELPAPLRAQLDAELAHRHPTPSVIPQHFAWLKVCVDADGNVTGVHARETSTLNALDAFIAEAQSWKLRPFSIDGHAIPVCALERLTYPADAVGVQEIIPFPSDDDGSVRLLAMEAETHRTAGIRMIIPEDRDKVAVTRAHVSKLIGSVEVCIAASGDVDHVTMLKSTRLPRYDAKIIQVITETWKYSPVLVNGKPQSVCTAVTFVYSQR